MLGSFKIRLLLVIIIVALVGLIMQSSVNGRQVVEPVIRYIIETDYDVDKIISGLIRNIKGEKEPEVVPVLTTNVLQVPCEYLNIERNYGWYYDRKQKKQEFCPGIYLNVRNNTLVRPVMKGKVEQILLQEDQRVILVKHDENFVTIYGGIKEVLVNENDQVDVNEVIGKTGTSFYLEIRNQDGPLNPVSIIK